MNFYPFHIGDYAAHTRNLSLLEDLAYRRLLDAYYLAEQPFNGSPTDVAREVGMRDQVVEVEYILNKFFERDGSFWSNKRADREIAKYHGKRENASKAGRASAQQRNNNRSTNVGKGSTDVGDLFNGRSTNQEPRTKNQSNTSAPTVAQPIGVSDSVWQDFCQHRKNKKAKLTQTALDGIEKQAQSAGWGLEDALRECCARGWTGFNAEWVANKKPGTDDMGAFV